MGGLPALGTRKTGEGGREEIRGKKVTKRASLARTRTPASFLEGGEPRAEGIGQAADRRVICRASRPSPGGAFCGPASERVGRARPRRRPADGGVDGGTRPGLRGLRRRP